MKKIVSLLLLLSTFALFGDSQENRCACSKPRPKKQKPKQTKQVDGDVDNSQKLLSTDKSNIVNEDSAIESSEPTEDSRCACSKPKPKKQEPKETKDIVSKNEEQKEITKKTVSCSCAQSAEPCKCMQSTGSCQCKQSSDANKAVVSTCLAVEATKSVSDDQSSSTELEQK